MANLLPGAEGHPRREGRHRHHLCDLAHKEDTLSTTVFRVEMPCSAHQELSMFESSR